MTFSDFVSKLAPLFNAAIAALAAIAIFIFLLGLTRFLFKVGDSHHREDGKQLILWGIIALFVLFCVGGILNFFAYDFFGQTVSSGGSVPTSPANVQTTGTPDDAFKFTTGGTFSNFNP